MKPFFYSTDLRKGAFVWSIFGLFGSYFDLLFCENFFPSMCFELGVAQVNRGFAGSLEPLGYLANPDFNHLDGPQDMMQLFTSKS